MAPRPEELIVMFEELAERLNIKLVQDKGDFSGGSCLVREENFIVVNKRKPLEPVSYTHLTLPTIYSV